MSAPLTPEQEARVREIIAEEQAEHDRFNRAAIRAVRKRAAATEESAQAGQTKRGQHDL